MKTMKILLIHTNGTSIDVDMSYKTLDDARSALKKAYDETKPCMSDTECENMSYCGENDALLYCNKTSVHVWKIVTTVPVLENIALNAKYAFTVIGGGWGYQHDLYVITSDNSVYYTKDFDEDNLENAKPEFIFKLDEELDFEKHRNDTGCDAPDITMYKAEDGMLKVLYCVGNYDNVPAYTQIMRQKRRESYK